MPRGQGIPQGAASPLHEDGWLCESAGHRRYEKRSSTERQRATRLPNGPGTRCFIKSSNSSAPWLPLSTVRWMESFWAAAWCITRNLSSTSPTPAAGLLRVYPYPGEFELEAMAAGAIRVLKGEEQVKGVYRMPPLQSDLRTKKNDGFYKATLAYFRGLLPCQSLHWLAVCVERFSQPRWPLIFSLSPGGEAPNLAIIFTIANAKIHHYDFRRLFQR